MMKSMRKAAALAIVLAAAAPMTATPALAANVTNVKITTVLYAGGRYLVYFNSTKTNIPCSCCPERYEIVVNDANGQALMSMVLSAQAQGKSVNIVGTGTCVGTSNDTEGVVQLSIT